MIETVVWFLLAYITVSEFFNRKERKRLMEMIMAKSLPEFKEAEKEEKSKPSVPEELPEMIPMDQATDQQFDKMIKRELGRETIATKIKDKLRRANG